MQVTDKLLASLKIVDPLIDLNYGIHHSTRWDVFAIKLLELLGFKLT